MRNKLILFIILIITLTFFSQCDIIKIAQERDYFFTKQDKARLEKVLPYLEIIAEDYDIPILFFITLIEHESSYRWIFGDNGHAVGFMQLHVPTAGFVAEKYKDYLQERFYLNLSFDTTYDLYKTPVRTTILSAMYFVYQYQRTQNFVKSVGYYNGINNQEYILGYFDKFSEIYSKYS